MEQREINGNNHERVVSPESAISELKLLLSRMKTRINNNRVSHFEFGDPEWEKIEDKAEKIDRLKPTIEGDELASFERARDIIGTEITILHRLRRHSAWSEPTVNGETMRHIANMRKKVAENQGHGDLFANFIASDLIPFHTIDMVNTIRQNLPHIGIDNSNNLDIDLKLKFQQDQVGTSLHPHWKRFTINYLRIRAYRSQKHAGYVCKRLIKGEVLALLHFEATHLVTS